MLWKIVLKILKNTAIALQKCENLIETLSQLEMSEVHSVAHCF